MNRILDCTELRRLITETAPLLMVDRLELAADGRSVRGIKGVSVAESFFQGHFPGAPIMPGVLQVAAVSQACEAFLRQADNAGTESVFWLKAVRRFKFRRPVRPGDLLEIELDLSDAADGATAVQAKLLVDGAVVSQGSMEADLVPADRLHTERVSLTVPYHTEPDGENANALDVLGLMNVIPHRFPFLLVDRILDLNMETMRAIVVKNVSGNGDLFTGSKTALFPGYLQVEAAAQAACVAALSTPGYEEKLGYFMSIDEAVFHQPVIPGDRILFDLNLSHRGRFGTADGLLYVGQEAVTEVKLKFALVDRE